MPLSHGQNEHVEQAHGSYTFLGKRRCDPFRHPQHTLIVLHLPSSRIKGIAELIVQLLAH